MPSPETNSVTWLLERINAGDTSAGDELLSLVYDELRALAARAAGGPGARTLQATALVHEVYLKVLGPSERRADWEGRRHFFAVAATAMRSVLADHARRAASLKRGGQAQSVTLHEQLVAEGDDAGTPLDLLDLHQALEELSAARPIVARVVELRFFAGLTMAEVATELGVSERMAFKHWRAGRALLAVRFADREG
ncbi:MAG: ECF-type sigma factor [Planctomycetota bacterium]